MTAASDPLVLVFDVGTQSARTLIIDSHGDILAKKKHPYEKPYVSPQTDWAEQDPDMYYRTICDTCRGVKEASPDLFARVQAVTITTIRDTVVCVDQQGKPLRPAILWLDKRMADGKPQMPVTRKAVFRAAGASSIVDLQYAKSHCNWIRENEPEIWKKTYKYLLLSGYLLYRMTGRMVDSKASMIGHIPYDNKHRTWYSSNALTYPVYPVEPEKLCELAEAGEVCGTISASFSKDSGLSVGLPVYASGSDKACELIGLGCVSSNRGAIGLGTTATFTYMSDAYTEPERFVPAYAALIPGKYNPEYEVYRGYWLISWFKKEFAQKEVMQAKEMGISAEQLLDEKLAGIPAGCEGLFLQPYFTPNVTMPYAKGAIVGFSDVHTRIHIYRAIVEGINFALIDGIRGIQKRSGQTFDAIAVGGGGSQSDEICQISADMYGVPVIRTQSYEATGIGAAISTFVGMKVFPDFETAVSACVRTQKQFDPRPPVHAIYQRLYEEVYRDIFPRLKPVYRHLDQVYKDVLLR